MNKEDFICPGCKVNRNWEHKCHSDHFGDCDCPDCRNPGTFGMMDWGSRSCHCKQCAEKKVIERFQGVFSQEDQELIYRFLKLKYKNFPKVR